MAKGLFWLNYSDAVLTREIERIIVKPEDRSFAYASIYLVLKSGLEMKIASGVSTENSGERVKAIVEETWEKIRACEEGEVQAN